MRFLLRAVVFGFLAACGASDDGEPSSPDASTCDRDGFAPANQTGERDDELGLLFYTGVRGAAPMIERLTIDLYFSLGAADEPHDFTFTAESLADCHTCVMLRSDCDESSCTNGKAFLVQSGTLSVETIGAIGTTLTGSLQSANFVEVTINPGDLETTPVPGGESWCLDSYSFTAPITGPL